MRRFVLLAVVCIGVGGYAHAGTLYRCTGGDGVPTYAAKPIPGQACVVFAKYQGAAPSSNPPPDAGVVYSYFLDGKRHFSTRPPVNPAATDIRTINYQSAVKPPAKAPTYVAPRSSAQAWTGYRSFKGYRCTVDCSGHEAGYKWAERRGIEHPDECGGRSQSFIEGCEAYAEEVQLEMIEDSDCSDDDGDELCDDW